MTTKHTPGPWFANSVERGDCNMTAIQGSDGGLELAVCYGTPEQRSANSRLIAAAPELFAALTLLLGDVETEESAVMTNAEKQTIARAALKKAEGTT